MYLVSWAHLIFAVDKKYWCKKDGATGDMVRLSAGSQTLLKNRIQYWCIATVLPLSEKKQLQHRGEMALPEISGCRSSQKVNQRPPNKLQEEIVVLYMLSNESESCC